jgi:hypothetical protein
MNPSGPDFNIMDNVLYFFNKLKMDSKVPYARFSSRSSAPINYQTGVDQLQRDEIRFEKFLRRLRSIFQEILVKPLYIQMCLDHPELAKDRNFKSKLGLNYHRESELEEMIQMGGFTKRIEFVNGLSEIKMKIGETETPYFDKEFLINRYLGITPDQAKTNDEYKKKEAKEAEKAAKEGGGEAAGGESEGGEAAPAPTI